MIHQDLKNARRMNGHLLLTAWFWFTNLPCGLQTVPWRKNINEQSYQFRYKAKDPIFGDLPRKISQKKNQNSEISSCTTYIICVPIFIFFSGFITKECNFLATCFSSRNLVPTARNADQTRNHQQVHVKAIVTLKHNLMWLLEASYWQLNLPTSDLRGWLLLLPLL